MAGSNFVDLPKWSDLKTLEIEKDAMMYHLKDVVLKVIRQVAERDSVLYRKVYIKWIDAMMDLASINKLTPWALRILLSQAIKDL